MDHIMTGPSVHSSANTDGYPCIAHKRETGKKVSGDCHQGAYQPKLAEVETHSAKAEGTFYWHSISNTT